MLRWITVFPVLLATGLLGLSPLWSIDLPEFAPAPGILAASETWTAFNWGKGGWQESVIARQVSLQWDESGRLVRRQTSLGDGSVFEVEEYEWGEKGLAGWQVFDVQGQLRRRIRLSPDEAALLAIVSNAAGEVLWSERIESAGQGWLFTMVESAGQVQASRSITLDQDGREVLRQAWTPVGSLAWECATLWERFDSRGLWLERLEQERYGTEWPRPRYRVRRSWQGSDPAADAELPANAPKSGEIKKSAFSDFDCATGVAELAALHSGTDTSGEQVITAALARINQALILPGSCFDFVNAVYNGAGFKQKVQRLALFRSPSAGPFADPAPLRPGDWLYYHHEYSRTIEHSAIFVCWLDFDSRAALVLDYPGGNRKEPGRYRVSDLYKVWGITRAQP